MKIQIDVKGTDKAIQRMGGLRDRAQDPSPAFRRVSKIFERTIKQSWATKGSNIGDPWRDLSESTMTRKAQQDLPAAILVATGNLERAVNSSPKVVVTKTMVKVGIKHPLVRLAAAQGRHIVMMSKRDRKAAIAAVWDYLEGRDK